MSDAIPSGCIELTLWLKSGGKIVLLVKSFKCTRKEGKITGLSWNDKVTIPKESFREYPVLEFVNLHEIAAVTTRHNLPPIEV